MSRQFFVRKIGGCDLRVLLCDPQPALKYLSLVLFEEVRKSLQFDVMWCCPGTCQLELDLFNHPLDFSRFNQIVIHLLPYGFKSGFKGGVSGEDESDSFGLCPAHGAHHGETIAGLADIQIGNQDIELLGGDKLQCLGHGRGWSDHESKLAQN